MEATFNLIFENYISKKTSTTWKVIVDAFGGQEFLKSKIGLIYIFATTDSVTLFFRNGYSKPNRVEVLQTAENKHRVIFRTLENYVYFVHSVFHDVKKEDFISLFERETNLSIQ
jgi:hypothetical protein